MEKAHVVALKLCYARNIFGRHIDDFVKLGADIGILNCGGWSGMMYATGVRIEYVLLAKRHCSSAFATFPNLMT